MLLRNSRQIIDFKKFKIEKNLVVDNLRNRNLDHAVVDEILDLHHKLITSEFKANELGKKRNAHAASIKNIAKSSTLYLKQLEAGRELKQSLNDLDLHVKYLRNSLDDHVMRLPNSTHPSVPVGDESKADIIYSSKVREFPFKPLDHMKLCEIYDMIDLERAGKSSGAGSYFLKNSGAFLEMALIRYAMDIGSSFGFTPIMAPDIIRSSVLKACGFAPRSNDPQTYFISTSDTRDEKVEDDPLCLAATAEFPLAVFKLLI
jgi:seryl-tRNA synthetase